MISASRAEVWKVDPSNGSIFLVTKSLSNSLLSDNTKQSAEKSASRQLQVEVTAAELTPAISGGYSATLFICFISIVFRH